jgi:hypothetical protein
LTEPLNDEERELRQRAHEAEREVEELQTDRALKALKATLGGQKASEELATIDERVSDLTNEALRSEAEAAKERADAELHLSEDERRKLREAQGSEERIREVTSTRRQLMIEAGALSASPGSEEMVEIALRVEDQMCRRFGVEAQWRMAADDAEFGLEMHGGRPQPESRPPEPCS